MVDTSNKFDVKIIEARKVDKNMIISFEFLKKEGNCRIKLESCNGFDFMGNKSEATEKNMSMTDVMVGTSRFFKDSQKVKVSLGDTFKGKNGSAISLMINDLDAKSNRTICFQKKGTRWDMVGVQ